MELQEDSIAPATGTHVTIDERPLHLIGQWTACRTTLAYVLADVVADRICTPIHGGNVKLREKWFIHLREERLHLMLLC